MRNVRCLLQVDSSQCACGLFTQKNYLNEHEIPTADMDLYISAGNELPERSWGSELRIEFEGQSYPLKYEVLHKALSVLSERYIGVLLLKYWHRMSDVEIASHFHISERTVRYWRRSAIGKIKRWYLGNHIKLDYPSPQD